MEKQKWPDGAAVVIAAITSPRLGCCGRLHYLHFYESGVEVAVKINLDNRPEGRGYSESP